MVVLLKKNQHLIRTKALQPIRSGSKWVGAHDIR